ncbi:MAG TPA: hypothetical protein VNK52_13030 [Hyphomicrobiaceae bacterium]|nr:hypothetical protein [Hyphomicrobiaceae bacterium]
MVYTGTKLAAGAALGAALVGAVYLYSVRGQALLLDLAATLGAFVCF